MFGANAMDLSLRPPAARAGYNQGSILADQLIEFWRRRPRNQSTR
jgi:NTE family protein